MSINERKIDKWAEGPGMRFGSRAMSIIGGAVALVGAPLVVAAITWGANSISDFRASIAVLMDQNVRTTSRIERVLQRFDVLTTDLASERTQNAAQAEQIADVKRRLDSLEISRREADAVPGTRHR